MIKTLAGFLTGVLVALSGAAVAGGQADNADVRRPCHSWADGDTLQCNLYFPDADRVRVRLFIEGEYMLGVDYWPGWEQATRISEAGR